MSERSTKHATFVNERTYAVPPARVFAAWADRAAKIRWFGNPDAPDPEYELDFCVGGREITRGGPPGGPVFTYDARYHEIVPDQRIVYAYTMDMDKTRISVSVTTVEFKPKGVGTHLIFTEQGVFLDGGDKPEVREHGTKVLLDKLDAALQPKTTSA